MLFINKILFLNIILGFASMPLLSQTYFESTGSIEIQYKKGNRIDTLKRPAVKATRIEELIILYTPNIEETSAKYFIEILNGEGEVLRIPESQEFLINGRNKLMTQKGSIIASGEFQFIIKPPENIKWPRNSYIIQIYSDSKMVMKKIFLII